MSLSKVFYEHGDIDAARKLLFNFDKINIEFDDNDRFKSRKSQKSILSNLLFNLENKKPVIYQFANGKKSGRVYSKGGMQLLKRDLRNTICSKYYYDIDIKNAQPTCLLWWCNKISMNVPVLTEYCNNRESYYHLKQDIINILYGGSVPELESADETELLNVFKKETIKIHDMMLSRKEFQTIKNQIERKQKKQLQDKQRDYLNVGGSLCAEILQSFENKCLQSALGFFESKEIPITNFILMFDGFMIPVDLWNSGLLDELNEHIVKDTEIPAIFVKKDMTDIFKIPSDWVYDAKQLKKNEIKEWYAREKPEFEKTVCRIVQPLQYLIENTDNSIYLCNKQEFVERFSEINCQGEYFTKIWLDDPNKRKYTKIEFLPPPKIVPDTTYNLWSGFEIEKVSDPETSIGLDRFKKVVSIMSGNLIEMETFIMNMLAHMIQLPAKQLPISLVLCGLEGTGKNVFTNTVQKIIGPKYCFETADLENEMFCRFKYNVMNKLLLVINEADPNETFKYEQKIKHWIGDGKVQSFEGKGTKPIDLEIFFCMFLLTNNMITPVNITPTDRRYTTTETSNEYRCDTIFWGETVDIFSDLENLKGVFNYLKNFKITIKNWANERPITPIYQRIKTMCFEKTIKGLRLLILEEWNSCTDTTWISNESLYKLCNITKQDEQSFSTRLGQKNITGIIRKQTRNGRGWDINRIDVYNWMIQNKFIFENEVMVKTDDRSIAQFAVDPDS